MNVWANAVITEKGLALLTKLTQGTTLDIIDAVTGAGYVTPGVLQKQTEVTDPKQTLKARPVSYPDTGRCDLPLTLTNEGLTTGYEATQVGVFANDPDEGKILFFIAQSVTSDIGTTIPSEAEMPGYSAEWTFRLQYGQADGVNVTVDPSNTVSPAEMMAYINAHFGICNATGDGMDYTASIPGLTELKKGMIVTIIPDTTSAATIPTLNVNGLGAKNIKQRLSFNTSLTAEAATDSWMVANKPVPLLFDGTQWVTITGRPSATTIYGKTPVKNGGTNASTADEARVNLGAAPADGVVYWSEEINGSNTKTEKIMSFFADQYKTIPALPITKVKAISDDHGVGLDAILSNFNNRISNAADSLTAYPVGSIYLSVEANSPANLFGGTWEQLKDRFLLGAGDIYSNGDTGGDATVTLTKEQMPEHTHRLVISSTLNTGTGTTDYVMAGKFSDNGTDKGYLTDNPVEVVGENRAHNNMPPYLVVYMWKRIA